MKQLPKICGITDRAISNLGHDEIVREMIAGGARLIQLRDKEAGGVEFLDAARKSLSLTRAAGAVLIVNDRVEVALTTDADGIHLGQEDMPVEEAREMLGDEKIIGISTHTIDQVKAALETSADYIAVGPVYPTASKADPDPVVGLELVRSARALTDRPLVAIGGINHDRALEVLSAGADCLAVISAFYPWPEKLELASRPDIAGSVRRMIELIDGSN